jgi:signal transduction histidine kinase/DNA-binding response OmpR family regulator
MVCFQGKCNNTGYPGKEKTNFSVYWIIYLLCMTKFRIEILIALLALVIGTAVLTAGYLSYISMSRIVDSVHREARPDNRLFLMKDINIDLTSMENSARLYLLTDNAEELVIFDTIHQRLTHKLEMLSTLPSRGFDDVVLTDSIRRLALEKQQLWQEILVLRQTDKGAVPVFKEIYSKLEQQKTDTVTIESEKKGFLRKIFGSKKRDVDTTFITRAPDNDEIKKELQLLESEFRKEGENTKAVESQLMEKNILLTARLNNLITRAEQRKADEFMEKSLGVDHLAQLTYKQLAAFSATAVLLLLIALFVLFRYLKRSRAYQDALRDARQKAENLARAKEQFVANVSHELRTPVNAIFGLTEQALQRELDAETRELVTIISRSSQLLKNIVNDTLDFSKIEANKIVFETIDFSPSEICREVVAIQKYEAKGKGISLTFEQKGDIPIALLGDPLRLKQILINLIGNAIKFTAQGFVTLYLNAKESGENRYRLALSVEDSGIGISREDLPIIFEEFVQAKSQSGNKQPGTGLGLPIVKKLVELQGGEITVKSEPGKGTRVMVEIPYQEGNPQNIKITGQEINMIPGLFQRISVLIADDDEYNTLLLRNILKKWGINFTEAKNGKKAVEASENHIFDVILMDIHMPEMGGLEAAKIIKSRTPQTKFIAVTATNNYKDMQECKKAGMDLILIKPFSEKELFYSLQQLIATETGNPVKNQPPANLGELEHLTNGDMLFQREMILLFISSTASARDEIQNAMNDNDLKSVFEIAHKIAASCKQIQANRLYALVKQLEGKSRMVGPVEQVIPLFQSLNKEMFEVHTYLRQCLEEMKS